MTFADENKTDRAAKRLLMYVRTELDDPGIEYESAFTRLPGGFETTIYEFRLNRFYGKTGSHLVLRLFPEHRPPENAAREFAVQNVLADKGYPVAHAYLLCKDKSVLGGAFFMMDFLQGKPMMSASFETAPETLAKIHIALHKIGPQPLMKSLENLGAGENVYEIKNRFVQLERIANDLPWTGDCVKWLADHRPPPPGRLAVCHGDFHPQNILMQDGKVTGVLDWPGFYLADPDMDVASTIWLISIVYQRQAGKVDPAFASYNWRMFSRRYLEEYRKQLPADDAKLEYFQVLRSIAAFRDAARGQALFRDPGLVKDIVDFIHEATGILIKVPE